MKKYRLRDKTAPAGRNIVGTYDNPQMADTAAYAGNQFKDLYTLILVENY